MEVRIRSSIKVNNSVCDRNDVCMLLLNPKVPTPPQLLVLHAGSRFRLAYTMIVIMSGFCMVVSYLDVAASALGRVLVIAGIQPLWHLCPSPKALSPTCHENSAYKCIGT